MALHFPQSKSQGPYKDGPQGSTGASPFVRSQRAMPAYLLSQEHTRPTPTSRPLQIANKQKISK